MARIFVSYRRDDSAGHAGRLADRLKDRFGRHQVFLDVDLPPGVDYAQHVRDTILQCDALIVVIGPRWATLEDSDGSRRLDNPRDLVRTEIETALQQPHTTTIPVLVSGASLPDAGQLPTPLRPLLSRNALEISDIRFDYDTGRLVEALEPVTDRVNRDKDARAHPKAIDRPSRLRRISRRLGRRLLLAVLVLACVIFAGLYVLLAPNNVVVPDVVGATSPFEAEKTLNEATLKLAPEQKQKITNDARPGTVIGQTPAAGEKAEKDTEVMLLVAVSSGKVRVPNLVGLTAAQAESELRTHKLTVGSVSPQPLDPAKKISRQSPAYNDRVSEGTPVDIFFP